MSDRTPYIAGNWKMHKTIAEARGFVAGPRSASSTDVRGVDVGLCVPYTALSAVVQAAEGSGLIVCAQNMHQEDSGAFTGEVSPPMLTELGVHGVVLGHSERREYYNETDRALQEKVPAALAAGLRPILCVGETEDERERDETQRKLRNQVKEGLDKLSDDQLPDVVIAYEPIWAIGTGTGRHARAGAGGDRLHPRAGRRPVQGGGRGRADPVRRQRQARQRRRDPRAARRGRRARGRREPGPEGLRSDRRRRGTVSGPTPPVPSVCLVILDGWGLAPPGPGNAVEQADTPVFDAPLV